MPIYEYQCSACEAKFEILRSLSQANGGVSCPKCGQVARRLISTFASFSKSSSGELSRTAGSGPGCGPCTSGNCSSCGA